MERKKITQGQGTVSFDGTVLYSLRSGFMHCFSIPMPHVLWDLSLRVFRNTYSWIYAQQIIRYSFPHYNWRSSLLGSLAMMMERGHWCYGDQERCWNQLWSVHLSYLLRQTAIHCLDYFHRSAGVHYLLILLCWDFWMFFFLFLKGAHEFIDNVHSDIFQSYTTLFYSWRQEGGYILQDDIGDIITFKLEKMNHRRRPAMPPASFLAHLRRALNHLRRPPPWTWAGGVAPPRTSSCLSEIKFLLASVKCQDTETHCSASCLSRLLSNHLSTLALSTCTRRRSWDPPCGG